MPAPAIDEDTRRLIDAVVKDLVAANGGSRDVGPDVSAPAAGGEDQRFFGGILSSIITDVVPKLAPVVLSLFQQRRRELGLPEQRDVDELSRDFGAILSALFPKLLEAVPGIVAAISGQPAPRDPQEEGQRFLPFLAALIPAVISAVPAIIGAFNKQRGIDETPPITDPEAQRFLGGLLATFVPQLLQAAPSILGSIFGGRDVSAPATTTAY